MGPVWQYFDALSSRLAADYPQLEFRVRSDNKIYRLESENIDIELGFIDPESHWDGVGAYMSFRGVLSVIWRNDRPAHNSWWTAQSLGHALTAWLTRRFPEHSRSIIQDIQIAELGDVDVDSDEVLFQVTWYGEVFTEQQFDYEGHLVGPPTPISPVGDFTVLGTPTGAEVNLDARNSE